MKRIIIRRAAALIIAACLCVALCGGAMAMEAGWKCPNCGRENPERANFCGSCRTQRPTATVTVEGETGIRYLFSRIAQWFRELGNYLRQLFW